MQCPCVPAWLTVLSALLTPTIALAVAFIALRQWMTARNKLKYDLFQQRYKFYENATKFISCIGATGRAPSDVTTEFLVSTKGAHFIVGAELAKYFDNELFKKAVLLYALDEDLKGIDSPAKRKENVAQQREIMDWLANQYAVLDRKFAPLLKLSH